MKMAIILSTGAFMKKLMTLSFLILAVSATAHAADDYACDLTISKEGKVISSTELAQAYGKTSGNLATLPLADWMGPDGTTHKTSQIQLEGVIRNAGQKDVMSPPRTSINATFVRIDTVGSDVERKVIATVRGKGDFDVNVAGADGYVITGRCEYRDGE
jgi:hypothetical protein